MANDVRDRQWASVKAAVRRLSNVPDFLKFLEELELMRDMAKERSYTPEVKKDHIALLEEVVLQETIDNILIVCTLNPSGVLDSDDEVEQFLRDGS